MKVLQAVLRVTTTTGICIAIGLFSFELFKIWYMAHVLDLIYRWYQPLTHLADLPYAVWLLSVGFYRSLTYKPNPLTLISGCVTCAIYAALLYPAVVLLGMWLLKWLVI